MKNAILAIPDIKAPRPDGFSSSFYRTYWEIVGDDVSKAVISFLNSGKLLKEVNTTTITLIPKVNCPLRVLKISDQFPVVMFCIKQLRN